MISDFKLYYKTIMTEQNGTGIKADIEPWE